jgi:hypothetical protein
MIALPVLFIYINGALTKAIAEDQSKKPILSTDIHRLSDSRRCV